METSTKILLTVLLYIIIFICGFYYGVIYATILAASQAPTIGDMLYGMALSLLYAISVNKIVRTWR